MTDAVAVVEFEFTLLVITVTVEMEAIILLFVELLHAMWRDNSAISLFAVEDWHKEAITRVRAPGHISFSFTHNSVFICADSINGVGVYLLIQLDC